MKIKSYLKRPSKIILSLGNHGLVNWLPDKAFISMAYRARMGKKLNWNRLLTFNEKLQWIKLYDRKPIYTTFVDKYAVREYAAKIIGDEYIIPLYGVWERAEDINFDVLPNCFVIKCTHDGGSVLICHDKASFDKDYCRKFLRKALKKNFFWHAREWPYKNVKPRIIAEKLLVNEDGSPIVDYKLQCFGGIFDNTLVCVDRFSETGVQYHYLDREWKLLPYSIHAGKQESLDKLKPDNYDEMIDLAVKLSSGIPELRVDFYEVNKHIFLGELTFFSSGGFDSTITEEADYLLGSKLVLPDSKSVL